MKAIQPSFSSSINHFEAEIQLLIPCKQIFSKHCINFVAQMS